MLLWDFFEETPPARIPPALDLSCMELLPKWDSAQNGIPPKTGFIPIQDSSQNGIPPKNGIPLKTGSKMFFGRNPVSGGIPFWEEFHFGRNSVLGGILF